MTTQKVSFKYVEYSNFRSVGNSPIRIHLNTHKTTLLCGKNGSGKTTFISAICFGLFGRGYGAINKPALINSINQKKLLVTIEFSIGKKNYKIVRGMKPSIFEIYENDKLINQDPSVRDYQKVLEQKILKFNYRSFSQVIAVGGGSDYVSFMRLSSKDRREFVEDLLDIRSFSVMNMLLKEESKQLKESMAVLNGEMKSVKEKIVLQDSFIKKLKAEKKESSAKIESSIREFQEKNVGLQEEVDILLEEYKQYDVTESDSEKARTKLTGVLAQIISLRGLMSKQADKCKFYEALTICPTCTQTVSNDYKKSIIDKYGEEVEAIVVDIDNLVVDEIALTKDLEALNILLVKKAEIHKKMSTVNTKMLNNTLLIKAANENLSDLQGNSSNINEEVGELKRFAKEYIDLDAAKKELLCTQQYHDFVFHILADSGIKSKIIKQYIPQINRLINKFLGDLDFFCSFYLDESFNETIKSRHRDSFTYEHFSDGQKRRIDLAILLTWVEVAKAKNSVNTNLICLDEVDANIDASGSDLLHSLLKTCNSDNIFIISHKEDLLTDKCDHTISFELKDNFTVMS